MSTASSGSKPTRGHAGGAANQTTTPATTAAGRNLVAGNSSPVILKPSDVQETPGRDTKIPSRADPVKQESPQESIRTKKEPSPSSQVSEKPFERAKVEQHSTRVEGKPSGSAQSPSSTKTPQPTESHESALKPPPIPIKQRPSQPAHSDQNPPEEAQGKETTPKSTPTLQTAAKNSLSSSTPQTASETPQSTPTPQTVTKNTQSNPIPLENPKTTPPNQGPPSPTHAPEDQQSAWPAADDVSLKKRFQMLVTVVDGLLTSNQLVNQRLAHLENFRREEIVTVEATIARKEHTQTSQKDEEERLRVLVQQIVQEAEVGLTRRVERVERMVTGVRDAVCRSVTGLLQGLTAMDGEGDGVVEERGVVRTGPGPEESSLGEDGGVGNDEPDEDEGENGDGADEKKPDDQASAGIPKPNRSPHTINGPDFSSSQVRLRSDDDDGEPKDGSVDILFGELEKKITNFVTKHVQYYVNEEVARDIAGGRWASCFPHAVWRRENPPKAQWFRARVADLIYLELFAEPVFDCDDELVEHGLRAFEQLMAPGGRLSADPKQRQDLALWRALTTRMLDRPSPPQPGQNQSNLSLRLADQLRDAFSTVLINDGKDLAKRLMQLCNKAVECALVVRRSRATYLWLQHEQPGSQGELRHEPARGENGGFGGEAKGLVGNGIEGGKFVFTVFGEVVKDQVEVEEDGRRFTVCASLRGPRVEVV